MDDALSIIDYTPQHKQALEDISLPWLLEYDLLEPVDLLELQGEGLCEALKFGVKEEYRRRGIGHALMRAVIQAARALGQTTLVVTSNHKLKDALRVYEDLGFQYTTYSDKWFQLSDIRMELPL